MPQQADVFYINDRVKYKRKTAGNGNNRFVAE
jgi:hypothetical protein